MRTAKLKFSGKEHELGGGIVSIGRTTDNKVSFPDDANVSRNHAETEERGGSYWLSDTGSSNGTTVNGDAVQGEVPLNDGDVIVLGGSSRIDFSFPKEDSQTAAATASDPDVVNINMPGGAAVTPYDLVPASSSAPSTGGHTGLLIGGGVALLLILVLAAGGVAYYMTRGPACNAKASIVKPETGDTIYDAAEIEIDLVDGGCVEKAVYLIDGVEFYAADAPPFDAKIDPKEFPDLADGFAHNLGVLLLDEKGEQIGQPPSVMLAFETRKVAPPPETNKGTGGTDDQPTQATVKGKSVSLPDIQEMSKRLVKQFSGNFTYNVSNQQFLQEVQKRTAEYAQPGYFEKAAKYKDAINTAFPKEQNVDAALGYILAMSRSKFDPSKQGSDEGLWKMSSAFVTANGYGGSCGTETLSDPSQVCAAKASALYMKSIAFSVFDGDMIYSAAVFGKEAKDAATWKSTLPADRRDIWKAIRTPAEREQIVRFFAAGIVAENPLKFGLKNDRAISELYRLTM